MPIANYKCKIITNDLNHEHKYKPKIFTNAFQLRHKYKHKVPSSCASWWRGLLTLTHWWNPLPHASLTTHTALHNWPLPLYIPHNKHWHTYSMPGCISKSIASLVARHCEVLFNWISICRCRYEGEIGIVLIRRYQRVIGTVNSTLSCISSPCP